MEREQGNYGRAATHYAESLALFRALDDGDGRANCLDGLASVACAENKAWRAARLAGAARSLRDALGTLLPPVDRAITDRYTTRARDVGPRRLWSGLGAGRGAAGETGGC